MRARDRYLVVKCDDDWVYIRKFSGKQFRQASYKVKRSECYKVPSPMLPSGSQQLEPESGDECDVPKEDVESDNQRYLPTEHTIEDFPANSIPRESPAVLPLDVVSSPTATDLDVTDVLVEDEMRNDVLDTPRRTQRQRAPPDRLTVNWERQSYDK